MTCSTVCVGAPRGQFMGTELDRVRADEGMACDETDEGGKDRPLVTF
jgi:hypothetical protein